MIHIDKNGLKMSGTLAEVSAECILILREIYKKNLENVAEPEIAAGILRHMMIHAADINFGNEEQLEKEIVMSED